MLTRLTVALLGLACAASMAAAQTPPLKIGFVDRQVVFETPRVQEVVEALRGEVRAAEQQLKDMEKKLEEMQDDYGRVKDLLTEEAREGRLTEIRDQQKQIREFGLERLRELREKQDQKEDELTEEIREIVTQIALEKGYTIVLWRSSIAYGAREHDLTGEVLSRFQPTEPGGEEGGE